MSSKTVKFISLVVILTLLGVNFAGALDIFKGINLIPSGLAGLKQGAEEQATTTQVSSEGTTAVLSEGTLEASSKGTTQVSIEGTTQVSSEGTTQVSSEGTTQVSSEGTTELPNNATTEKSTGILSRDPNDVHFLLYPDPSNVSYYEQIIFNDTDSLSASSFDPAKPLKVLSHGFLSNGFGLYPQNVKNAYLNQSDIKSYNVIIVDWGRLAEPQLGSISAALYGVVVDNVARAGKRVGNFLLWLHNETNADLQSAHLVGHSLGSHVSGWAGKTVLEATEKPVARITALDPAGPLFYTNLVFRSIDRTDASFIDAYHTNTIVFGKPLNVGDVDFFINDGASQPGCTPLVGSTCSHSRAHQFFARSILMGPPTETSEGMRLCVSESLVRFVINKSMKTCTTHRILGEYCPAGTKGKFYFQYGFEEDIAEEKAAAATTTTTTTSAPSS